MAAKGGATGRVMKILENRPDWRILIFMHENQEREGGKERGES